jgi:hypothetical protein
MLKNEYYDLKSSGSYLGPVKLYQSLKMRGINISLYQIRKWLKNQDDYSLQRPARRPRKRVRVVVSGIDNQWDADLADMSSLSRFNGGIKYLLVVIDIFSRFLWVQPLKNKTAKEVVEGFKHILQSSRKCKKLRTDKGSEFTNKIMKEYLKNQNIYFFTTQNSDTKANYAERVIQTLKSRIYRYFTKNRTKRYIDVLNDFVQSYNNTPHTSLGNVTPKDVTKANEADVWAFQYLKPVKTKSFKRIPFQLKVNDMVRISHENAIFKRAYNEQFSKEIFKVAQRSRMQGIPMYKIKDFSNEAIRGNFYGSELQKVEKDENALWIIDKKIRKRTVNGKVEYLVSFEGWPSKYNMWVSASDINDLKTTESST